MVLSIPVTDAGRLSLPADLRRRLGLARGGVLYLEESDTGLVLRTAAQTVAHAQALARQHTAERVEAAEAAKPSAVAEGGAPATAHPQDGA